jgi:hypothetical protein
VILAFIAILHELAEGLPRRVLASWRKLRSTDVPKVGPLVRRRTTTERRARRRSNRSSWIGGVEAAFAESGPRRRRVPGALHSGPARGRRGSANLVEAKFDTR